jgi:hypothetical protein
VIPPLGLRWTSPALSVAAALACVLGACSADLPTASSPASPVVRPAALPANTAQYERMNAAMEKARTSTPNTPVLESVAHEQIDCTSRQDVLCGRLFIMRASACSQLANTGNAASAASSRECAAADYRTALDRLPADNADDDRIKALIGLANALKTQRDFAATSAESSAIQSQLDGMLPQLDAAPRAQPFAQYFHADSLAFAASDPQRTAAQACQQYQLAQSTLPASPADTALAQRVARLRSSIKTLSTAKGCP